jgi:signal transduction histidine kinase
MAENGGSSATRLAQVVRKLAELEEQLRRDEQARRDLDARWHETLRITHALNNALSVIGTFAKSVQDELEPDDASLRESVDEILEASKRAAALTRDLAALARRDG